MNIDSNGSKWGGDAPDSVETLLDVLKKEILDPKFFRYGNFFYRVGTNEYQAFGNFLTLSHVFRITGTKNEMLPLARALKDARKRPEYLKEWAREYRCA